MELPKISIWITSTGRYEITKRTIAAFLKHNTYTNYEFLIFHSILTPQAKVAYTASDVGESRTMLLFHDLLQDHPGKMWAEPWPPFGNALTTLLENSAEFFINLGDANMTAYDGKEQLIDGISLLRQEKSLLGLRLDFCDDSVYDGSPRFTGTRTTSTGKYVYWPIYPVSAQLVDTEKMKQVGFPVNHDLKDKNYVEVYPQARMRQLGFYCGIDLNHKGFLHHINTVSTTNEPRQWRVDLYDKALQGIKGVK